MICTRLTELQTRDELEVRALNNSTPATCQLPTIICPTNIILQGNHPTTTIDDMRALDIATCITRVAEGFAGDRSSRGRGRARDEEEKERARVQGSSLPILSRAANRSRRCSIRWLPDYPGRTVFDLPSTPDCITVRPLPLAAGRRLTWSAQPRPSFCPPPRAPRSFGERAVG